MSTTFANSINNNLIYADRAEHDAAGNDLQTTYATKAELPEFSQAEQDAMDSGITSTKVGNYDNHLADTTIHVTSADKTAWNGKQDAINDLSTIRSGASAGATAVQPGDLAAVAVSGDYDDLLNKPVIPTVPVQDVTVDGASVLNAQGVAEITMPTFTQAQADWTEADTTDPSYIQNNPTLAAVATSGAYADLSGTPTINNVPAVTSSDDNKVLKASYSGGVGSYSWEAESGGTVTDVEVDGTSVVSGGVASITMPTELVPAVGSGDNAKVLTAAYDSGTGTGSYSWKVPDGLFIAQYGTSTYDEIDAAAHAGKIVYCYVNGRFAFLAYTNTTGGNDYNYEFQYYRSAASGKDSVFIYKVRPAGSIYGPEWETTQRDVKAGNISYPVTNVKVNGSSVMSGTVAEITMPTIPVTDVEVDGTSVVNASGVAEITMPTELVPTVTSSDDGKVLKAAYSGGTGSYSWESESGGGGADWDAQSGEPGYIENKPVPKTLVAGTGITVTENSTQLVVASTNASYSAGTGLTLNNTTFAVDTSVVATQNDIPTVDQTYDGTSANAQSGVAVASGISDAVAALPTNLSSAQIQSLKEALGVDETVLWEGNCLTQGGAAVTLSEAASNFEKIAVYAIPNPSGGFNYPQIFTYDGSCTMGAYMCPFMTANLKGKFSFGRWEITNGTSFSLTDAGQTDNYPAVNFDNSYGGIVKVVGINRVASN